MAHSIPNSPPVISVNDPITIPYDERDSSLGGLTEGEGKPIGNMGTGELESKPSSWEEKLLSTLHSLEAGLTKTRSEIAQGRAEQSAVKLLGSDNAASSVSMSGFDPKVRFPFESDPKSEDLLGNLPLATSLENFSHQYSYPVSTITATKTCNTVINTPIVTSRTDNVHTTVENLHKRVTNPSTMSSGNTRDLNSSADRFDALEAQVDMIATSVRMIAEILKQAYRPKAIPPPKFISGGNQNMRSFFYRFEKYCNTTYAEQHEDWVYVLASYLEGQYLELYHQINNESEKDYLSVKAALLNWWDYEHQQKKEKATQDFMLARMKPGESINMFALRLEQLANRAYPGLVMRNHEMLRRNFLHCLPPVIEQRMHDYILNVEGTTGQKLTFDQIVRLASQHHRECVSEQSSGLIDPEVIEIAQVRSSVDNNPSQSRTSPWSDVMKRWSSKKPNRPVENNSKGNNNSSQGSLRRNSGNNDNDQTGNRSAANNNGSRDSRNNQQPRPICDNCSKVGHDVSMCYELLGICSYCREQGHHRSECSQLKQRQQQRNTPQTHKPSCPFCKGDHFGKDCQSKGNSVHKSVGSINQPVSLPQRQPKEYSAQGARAKDNNPFTYESEGACGSNNNPLN